MSNTTTYATTINVQGKGFILPVPGYQHSGTHGFFYAVSLDYGSREYPTAAFKTAAAASRMVKSENDWCAREGVTDVAYDVRPFEYEGRTYTLVVAVHTPKQA